MSQELGALPRQGPGNGPLPTLPFPVLLPQLLVPLGGQTCPQCFGDSAGCQLALTPAQISPGTRALGFLSSSIIFYVLKHCIASHSPSIPGGRTQTPCLGALSHFLLPALFSLARCLWMIVSSDFGDNLFGFLQFFGGGSPAVSSMPLIGAADPLRAAERAIFRLA